MDGLLSVSLHAVSGRLPTVRLLDVYSQVEYPPLARLVSDATLSFQALAFRQYYLTFEHHQPAGSCLYFQAHLSFTSYYQLLQDTECIPGFSEKDGFIELRGPGSKILRVT